MDTNVLFIWDVRKELQDYLQKGLAECEDVQLIFPSDTRGETFLHHAPYAHIIVGWRPTEKLLKNAEKLSLFINPGVGVQHLIDLFRNTTRERQITLVNGHGNTYFAAQHTVALLLALMNKVIPHHKWMADGQWRKGDEDAISLPLRERVVGFLGYGAVNSKVHRFLAGFDVSFAALRTNWENQQEHIPSPLKKFTPAEIHQFLKDIDILIIAVPQTSLTKDLIAEKELTLLGRNGLLVNVARGVVVNENDLFHALKEGIIGGAALDVWYEYRPKPEEDGRKYPYHLPFHTLNNVVLSSHRAASPFNDLKRWDEVIENIKRYSKGIKEFLNVVDLKREY
jgi:phosphoglycerate dehydrogenase-like enzyme